jgi:hypothetical protein
VNAGTVVVVGVLIVVVVLLVVLVALVSADTGRLAWLLAVGGASELHPATSEAMTSRRHVHTGRRR